MDNALLVSLSQQLASYQSMDVIANNIANASTPGFKRESPTFQEYVAQVAPGQGEHGKQPVSFVQDTGTARDLTEGHFDTTDSPFDLALHGKGYFAIQTPAGERYTRNGHFSLDPSGQIVTDSGSPVLGDGGPITITPDDGDIHIGADGTVSGKTGQIAKLRVVNFANEPALRKEGASLYAATETPTASTDSRLTQGMLESSNVQTVVEMSRMIQIMRAYEATATLSKSQEDLTRQAIDKLGSVPSS